MSPATASEAQPRTPGRLSRYAGLPIPLLLAAIVAARMAGLRDTYPSHTLLLVLSFTCYTLVSLGTLYLIGRNFLASGSPGLLLLECGVVLWSLAGTVGDFVSHGDANIDVTIFNTAILLAGLCHLAGALLALRPQRALRAKPLWLAAGCSLALGALWLVAQAALSGWLPIFFIPGQGGTPVRYCVLISAVVLFVLSAGVLRADQRAARLPFTSWYSLALLLLAVGLFGVMIQLSMGSVVNWLSRTAQWLGGIYLLFASLAALRQSQLPLLPTGNESHPAYYREAVAVAIVLAAAAIRLAFLPALGMQVPFATFYPAVMFAAMYGGWRPGLLATLLSAVLADYFWIAPVNQFAAGQPANWLALMVFLMSGAMIAGVSDAMLRASARAAAAEAQALLAAEREAAAKALEENESRLRLAQESAHVGIWDWKVETGELDFTPELNELYGLPPGTIKTYQDWRDRVHPNDIDRIEAGREEAITRHEPFDLEFRGLHTSGEYRWISTKGGAIYNDAGKGERVFGVNIDITERKRAEEALKDSEERLRMILQASSMGTFEMDLQTGEGRWNDVEFELLGLKPGGVPGNPETFFQYVHPDDVEVLKADWEAALRSRGLDAEFRVVRADGRERWLAGKGRFFYEGGIDGSASRFLGVNFDITERKRAEEAVKQSQKTFAELIERAPFGIYVVDSRFRIEQMNTGSQNGAFRNVRPVIGRDFSEAMRVLWPEPVAVEIIGHFRHTLETGEPYYSRDFIRPRSDVEIEEAYEWELHRIMLQDGHYGVICYYFDSTSLRQAEKALRAREADLNEAQRLAHIGSWHWDAKTDVTTGSDELLRIYGFDPATQTMPDFKDQCGRCYPVEDWERVNAAVQEAMETGIGYELDVRAIRNGMTVSVTTRGETVRDADGRIVALRGTVQDITERKQAEEVVRESEERYRAVVENTTAIVLRIEPSGVINFANSRALEFFGYTADELIGRHAVGTIIPARETTGRDLEAMVRQIGADPDSFHSNANENICKDGRRVWVEWTNSGVYGADGRMKEFLSVGIDATARKRAEEALQESETHFRTMADAMPQLAWIARADGYITWYNRRWYEYTGTTPEQMEGWGWQNVHDPIELPKVLELWQASIATGEPFEMTFPLAGADGVFRLFLTRGFPLKDSAGRVLQWFGTNTDVSALKQAEQQVRASLAEKDVLLREIHHRVKNNLQVISSLVSLQADSLADEGMREVFGDVRDRVRAMALVHENLYRASDLAQLNFADYAAGLLQYLWRSHGALAEKVRLQLTVAPVALPIEAAVPCGLILNELAGNALKHAFPAGGAGEVTVGLEHDPAAGAVCLRVRDNGVGLPPDLDWRQSKSLGLRLVQMLAGQLHGTVDTGIGPGAEFRVTFPFKGCRA